MVCEGKVIKAQLRLSPLLVSAQRLVSNLKSLLNSGKFNDRFMKSRSLTLETLTFALKVVSQIFTPALFCIYYVFALPGTLKQFSGKPTSRASKTTA